MAASLTLSLLSFSKQLIVVLSKRNLASLSLLSLLWGGVIVATVDAVLPVVGVVATAVTAVAGVVPSRY